VVIAPATRRLLGNLFRPKVLGRHAVKGLSEPVEAWAVEGTAASEGRFEAVRSGRLTGFVGREYELGLLLERWNLAQDGEGQVVLLSGEPGIGKSRILSELRGRLEAQHATAAGEGWRRCRGAPSGVKEADRSHLRLDRGGRARRRLPLGGRRQWRSSRGWHEIGRCP
jgi:AAA ATPase domain